MTNHQQMPSIHRYPLEHAPGDTIHHSPTDKHPVVMSREPTLSQLLYEHTNTGRDLAFLKVILIGLFVLQVIIVLLVTAAMAGIVFLFGHVH
jgi:hypothetical protein